MRSLNCKCNEILIRDAAFFSIKFVVILIVNKL